MGIEEQIVIFAKRPQAGKAKTRLSKAPSQYLGAIPLETGATIYQAFLDDYGQRFSQSAAPGEAIFCLPDRPESHDKSPLCASPLPILIEPKKAGCKATSIGEAMSFTIRHLLEQGVKKVLVLGSDLPHIPFQFISSAFKLLDTHPLVLGNDGGGCYLVAASENPGVLEDPSIVWSEGSDFAQIVERQEALGLTVGIVTDPIDDIDDAADLDALIQRLQSEAALRSEIPATVAALQKLGAAIPNTCEGNEAASMNIVVNGEKIETPHSKLADLMSSLDIKRQGCAVEINEEIVPRARIDDQKIADGDVIEIVRLVGGG
ncbi:MAG: sulfur carrier protein ThiS [Planctomycetota bacterium]|nr:sulfur carrier protein ThiS [Planctomycetota bacterium]